jgi:hydrogenase/urease accessory protein HupE
MAAALALTAAGGARCHDAGISDMELRVHGEAIEASLALAASALQAALPANADPFTALASVSMTQGGSACSFDPGATRAEPPDRLRMTGTFRCPRAAGTVEVRVGLLERMPKGHTGLVKVVVDGRLEEHVLRAGRSNFAIDVPLPWPLQALRFLRLGIEHILSGFDHIAFVLGLLLLGGSLRGLCWTVTSFTVAHSVTLVSSALRFFSLPSQLVEPLIAASIVWVAVENLLQLRRPSAPAESRRWALGFVFGLVHGFGFAGALQELHLPLGSFAPALLSFNLGVEIGQAAIVAMAFPLLGWLRRRPTLAVAGLRFGSLAIGAAGVVWLLQRLPWMAFGLSR